MMYVAFLIFRQTIEKAAFKCPNVTSTMHDLGKLFALYELVNNDTASVYEAGFFSMGTASILNEALKKLLVKIRPQMIPLIEAWEIPDNLLVSAIGNSYGDIYE